MRVAVIFLCVLFCQTLVYGQQKRPEIDLDDFIQRLFPLQNEEDQINDYDKIYESLSQLYINPLDLNEADKDDLENLRLLSEIQINSLLKHIQNTGKLLSIYELQSIPYFDESIIEQLRPFVTVEEKSIYKDNRSLWKRIASEKENHYLISRYSQTLQTKKGYTVADTNSSGIANSRYLGSREQIYVRYRINHPNDFSLGITLEKDAGEGYLYNTARQQYVFDYFSAHFMVENQGHFKRIVLGDYQIGIGQNLLLSAGFTTGKGGESITTVRRSHRGIRPYTSALETNYLRGAAATYQLNRFELTAFFSSTFRDAGIVQTNLADSIRSDSVILSNETYIESIRATGLHRTQSEINAKSAIHEQIFGANVVYNSPNKNLQIGATFMQTDFNIPLKRVDRVYNRFEFNGKTNQNYGLHFSYSWQNFNFFGELAQSSSGGVGAVAGFVSSLSPTIDFSMLYRRYDRNFHSFYGTSFSEGTRPINETGLYWGLKIKPNRKWEFNSYFDTFSFPFLRFQADAPSQGYEFLAKLIHKPTKKINIWIQYREESKQFNQRNSQATIDYLNDRITNNYTFNVDFQAEKHIHLKTRVQVNTIRQGGLYSEGYMIAQDVGVDLGKFKFDARFVAFDDDIRRNYSDDYGSTYLYVFEKNILWAPTMQRYSGKGIRYVLMARVTLLKNLDIWLRYAQTERLDSNTIGYSLEQINGNRISTFTAQVRYQF